jgi:multiple sugar transport system permease protein
VWISKLILFIVFGVFLFWWLFPVYWMLSSSFKIEVSMFTIPPQWIFKPSLENYKTLFSTLGFSSYVLNSIIASSFSTAIALFLGSLAGYGLARGKIPRKNDIAFWMISTRMAPIVGVILPLYLIFRGLHLVGTLQGLIIAYTTFNLPFAVWLMRGFFMEIPRDVEEAALVDGCSKLQTFFYVALPLAKPGLVAMGVLCFMFAWNDYAFAVIFTSGKTQTLPVACARLMTEYGIVWGQVMTTGTILVAPVLFLGIVIRKYLVRGLTMGAIR